MINLPSNPSHFVFPFSKPQVDETVPDVVANTASGEEVVEERPPMRRARSKSLPIPGAFPFTPDSVDFSLAELRIPATEDDATTPLAQTTLPPLLIPNNSNKDIEEASIATTEIDDDEDEADLSTVDSIVVLDTAEATATTPTFYRAQSVRIVSSGTPPIGYNVSEKSSSTTVNTLPEKLEEEQVNTNVRESDHVSHSHEEIGIARTSDLFIPPPVSLPTPVQSPIVGKEETIEPMPAGSIRRPSADSSSEGQHSVKDIVKERRRRSKYYVPAPAPTAPDFYPEHHTEEEIVAHYQRDSIMDQYQQQPSPETEEKVVHVEEQPPPIPPARKSPREELMDLYTADPEFDEDQIPTKRMTIKPVKPLRATSPLGPQPSPGLAKSSHSDSSESLTARSHSSSALSGERRQYPSLDLPRPGSNRDIPTPTSAHGERAGLRVWTPPATPDATKGRTMRSTSFSKSKGHTHSNSISSQTSQKIKTLISGRPTTAEEKKSGSRNESDTDSAYSDTHTSKNDEKERSFEQLINSGTTLQYTLTPDNVKRIDLEVRAKTQILRGNPLLLLKIPAWLTWGKMNRRLPPLEGRALPTLAKSRPLQRNTCQLLHRHPNRRHADRVR